MPAGTSGSTDLEFLAADGVTVIPVMLVATVDQQGNEVAKKARGALNASQADSPLAEWLEPVVQKSWIGGVGIDYNAGDAVYTRTDGYAIPAGAVTPVTIPVGGTLTPIVAFAEYDGDLWCIEQGSNLTSGRVLQLAGGTGTPWVDNPPTTIGVGEVLRDLCVADNGAGTPMLFVSATDSAGANGRLHRWDGSAWSSSAVGAYGTNGRRRMKRVFWTTPDGVGAPRLVVISGDTTLAYTLPNADPLQNSATSWVEDAFVIPTDTYADELAAARNHVWVSTKSGLHDLTADGEAPDLLGYEDRNPIGLPYPVLYFGGYIYRAGAGTLTRIRVDGDPTIAEIPGQCAPGWGTEMESEWRGHITAMCVDQGFIVVSVFNPITTHTGVFWGMDRAHFPPGTVPDGRNPLIWYGPELYSNPNRLITAMTTSMLAAAGDRRLWVAAYNTTTGEKETIWQSLPLAGAPISDLISGGFHRVTKGDGTGNWNQRASLRSMPFDWNDPTAAKYLNDLTIKTRGLDTGTGTKITVWVRADPAVGSLSFSNPQDITVDPATTYTPAATTAGHLIDYRVYFTAPQGQAASAANVKYPVLDAIRMTAWRIAPAFRVLDLVVEYGDGVTNRENMVPETLSPDAITALLKGLTEVGRTTMRDANDNRWTVKLRQVLDCEEEITGGDPFGKRVTCRLQVALIAAL